MMERRAGSTNTGSASRYGGVPAEPRHAGDALQRPLRSRFRARLMPGVIAPRKLGVSCRVKVPAREGLAHHLYRVWHLWRRWQTPNESEEAYPGNSGGRKGERTP